MHLNFYYLICIFVYASVVKADDESFRTTSLYKFRDKEDVTLQNQKMIDKRELSFSTSRDTGEYRDRDHRQGRIPSRAFSGTPVVKVTRSEVHGLVGSNNITLECFIDSFPKSINFWMKGDLERLKPQENPKKYKITEDNIPHYEFRDRIRLHFLNLDKDDIGNKFRCVASNEYGTESGLIHLYSPLHLESKPKPENAFVEVPLRARVLLQCEVKGYPLTVTYWFRNNTGEQLSWNDEYRVTEHKISHFHYVSTLQIKNAKKEDFTAFKCVSKNTFGERQHVFRIMERNSWNPILHSASTANTAKKKLSLLLWIGVIFLMSFRYSCVK